MTVRVTRLGVSVGGWGAAGAQRRDVVGSLSWALRTQMQKGLGKKGR